MKLDVIQPANGCGVLVLLADGFTAFVDFDAAGLIGQSRGRHVASFDGMQGVHEPNREAARGAKPCAAGRNVCHRGDFESALQSEHTHAFANNRMLQLRSSLDFFGTRVADAKTLVEFPADGDIDIFVDGRGNNGPAMFEVVGWQVAAAASEADAEGCLGNDHERSKG